MPQYEFIEVRFLARSEIRKVSKAVKRFFFFDGTDITWPDNIEYNLIALQQGATTVEEIITQGKSKLVDYSFIHEYGHANPSQSVSIDDITSGALGSHLYYPIDLSGVQSYIMQYLNKLGEKGWELVSAPPALGSLKLRFDIEKYGPGVTRIDFQGGQKQIFVGQSSENPSGYAYSLKCQR